MQWWAWIAVGTILLGSELTAVVSAQFYLVFLGAAALLVGFVALLGAHLADWLQWVLFAVLATLSMVGLRRRVYQRMHHEVGSLKTVPAGETVILPADLPPGDTLRLEYRGSSWSAKNAGRSVIAAGARARIERIEGLTLIVHSDH
jgi:inner membrane protein